MKRSPSEPEVLRPKSFESIEGRILRAIKCSDFEIRESNGKKRITGYAAKYFDPEVRDTEFELAPNIVERIAPGFFDDVMDGDTVGLFNHDPNFVLGRTPNTLRMELDDVGLFYDIEAPTTQTIDDLVIQPIGRGDIRGSSFGFRVAADGQRFADDGPVRIRWLTRAEELLDVSPVTYPAYKATTTQARSAFERDYEAFFEREQARAALAERRAYLETLFAKEEQNGHE